MSLTWILLILLIVFVLFGAFPSNGRAWYVGWSPAGLILLILLILLLTGNLHV